MFNVSHNSRFNGVSLKNVIICYQYKYLLFFCTAALLVVGPNVEGNLYLEGIS